jgi:Tuberculosis necrotizing toxin
MTAASALGREAAGSETQRGPYNPWDNVAIYAVEDDEELGLYKGQVLVMPAINLFYFRHQQLKGHLIEAVDIITLLVGIGEIRAAVSVGRWLMAAADIIIGTGNIATRTFGHTMPDGWVASWHRVSSELIGFQFISLGIVGVFNYRAIVGGLKQAIPALVAGAKNTVQLAALKMVEVCEQLLDFAERILTSFDTVWLNKLLTDLDASKLAQKGSEAYTNLSKAIKDRLAVLKEKVAFTSKTDTPVPFREEQLTHTVSGNLEYLYVKLDTGELFTLKRENGGEWFVAKRGNGKTTNAEVLGRVPGRFKGQPIEYLVRGITKKDFLASVKDFINGENKIVADQAWDLWQQQKWNELENLFTINNINGNWPPNRGFIELKTETLRVGYEIDRYGGRIDETTQQFTDKGTFVSPQGTAFESRALPTEVQNKPLRKYKVVKDIPNVNTGSAIPWFNKPGMGIQHELPKGIDKLIEEGYIIQIL